MAFTIKTGGGIGGLAALAGGIAQNYQAAQEGQQRIAQSKAAIQDAKLRSAREDARLELQMKGQAFSEDYNTERLNLERLSEGRRREELDFRFKEWETDRAQFDADRKAIADVMSSRLGSLSGMPMSGVGPPKSLGYPPELQAEVQGFLKALPSMSPQVAQATYQDLNKRLGEAKVSQAAMNLGTRLAREVSRPYVGVYADKRAGVAEDLMTMLRNPDLTPEMVGDIDQAWATSSAEIATMESEHTQRQANHMAWKPMVAALGAASPAGFMLDAALSSYVNGGDYQKFLGMAENAVREARTGRGSGPSQMKDSEAIANLKEVYDGYARDESGEFIFGPDGATPLKEWDMLTQDQRAQLTYQYKQGGGFSYDQLQGQARRGSQQGPPTAGGTPQNAPVGAESPDGGGASPETKDYSAQWAKATKGSSPEKVARGLFRDAVSGGEPDAEMFAAMHQQDPELYAVFVKALEEASAVASKGGSEEGAEGGTSMADAAWVMAEGVLQSAKSDPLFALKATDAVGREALGQTGEAARAVVPAVGKAMASQAAQAVGGDRVAAVSTAVSAAGRKLLPVALRIFDRLLREMDR